MTKSSFTFLVNAISKINVKNTQAFENKKQDTIKLNH